MSVGIEALFTSALGLQAPWAVRDVRLDTAKHRIDFDVECKQPLLACPACGAAAQKVHDRLERSWRHLDFFQYEAWLHADVPRVGCTACGKTTQMSVPWAREGSGFTLLFEALALTMCKDLPVRQAARDLRVRDKQLWRRIEHYVTQARKKQDMSRVRIVGIDETSLRRGHDYVTVVHDLDAKRLLFCTQGRDHTTIQAFAKDLQDHGGEPTAIAHACMDMSAAYLKGTAAYLPNAQVSYDRFYIVKLAGEAMDEVRKQEWQTEQARGAGGARRSQPQAAPLHPVGHAQKSIGLVEHADPGHALAAARQPEDRACLAPEDGAARGVRQRPQPQPGRAGRCRSEGLAVLGSP